MDKKDQNLNEAYDRVSHKGEQLDEWAPVNRMGLWAKKFATGRSDIPGSGIVGAITKNVPGLQQWADKTTGSVEVGQEANRLWRMFSKDVLAHNPEGVVQGQDLLGWLEKSARLPVKQLPSLQNIRGGQPYDTKTLRGMFPGIVADAQRFHKTGQTGQQSQYIKTREEIIQMILTLSVDQKVMLINVMKKQNMWPEKPPTAAPAPEGAPAPAPEATPPAPTPPAPTPPAPTPPA